MKNAIVISVYACLVLIGGVIGFVTTHSLASIIASSIFGVLLLASAYFLSKGHSWAKYVAVGLSFSLLCFFTYRYFLAYKFFPGGAMSILSAGLLIYLLCPCSCRLSNQSSTHSEN